MNNKIFHLCHQIYNRKNEKDSMSDTFQEGKKHHLLLERLHTELSRSISDFSVDFLAISIAMFRSSIHFPISKRVLQDKQCEWWPPQPGAMAKCKISKQRQKSLSNKQSLSIKIKSENSSRTPTFQTGSWLHIAFTTTFKPWNKIKITILKLGLHKKENK